MWGNGQNCCINRSRISNCNVYLSVASLLQCSTCTCRCACVCMHNCCSCEVIYSAPVCLLQHGSAGWRAGSVQPVVASVRWSAHADVSAPTHHARTTPEVSCLPGILLHWAVLVRIASKLCVSMCLFGYLTICISFVLLVDFVCMWIRVNY